VFVFKRKATAVEASPKKKARRKSAKPKPEAGPSSTFCHFGLEKKGLDQFRAERFQLYRDLSEKIGRIMVKQQKETFGKVLADVQAFVRFVLVENLTWLPYEEHV